MGERDSWGVWNGQVHAVFRMDNRLEPNDQHKELCSMLRDSTDGGRLGGEWTHLYMWLNSFTVRLKLSQPCKSAIPQYKGKRIFFLSVSV